MRIAGGTYRSRVLDTPKSDEIRPTQERVREALFSMLMHETPGARFLDLFAGSGAMGLEAISRGAAHATFVEKNPRHAAVLKKNIAKLGPDCEARARVITQDAYAFIASPCYDPYDIVFADPPYALGEAQGYADVLANLAACNIVKHGGIFIAEMANAKSACEADGWELLKIRSYGKTSIALWRRAPEDV